MVERITLAQQHAVNEQRRMGRTDRQIEKIVGLPQGLLSRPFSVDLTEERERAQREARDDERRHKEDAFWRAVYSRDRTLRGWRPEGDCVSSRPDEKPLRAVRSPAVTRGAK